MSRGKGLVLEGGDGPQDRVATVAELRLELQAVGDDGVDSVGADRHVAALFSAVGEAHDHAGIVLRHRRALAPELDRVPGSLGEDTLQV